MKAMSKTRVVRHWGFKGPKQLPLFMIWEEYWDNGEVSYARVLFNSKYWIGI